MWEALSERHDMKNQSIPSPVAWRLSLYLRQLESLDEQGVEKISSRNLAESLQVTDAQVRKDLAYFGQFGRPGVGYRVAPLIEQIRHILGTDRIWKVVVVGAGDLGRALLRYRGFRQKGFELVAAFDVSDATVGSRIGRIVVRHVRELPGLIRRHEVKLAVVAVPPDAAQDVTDQLQRAGVKGILNFAPTTLQTDNGLVIRQVDLAAHLQQLSFRVGTTPE